MKQMHCFIPFNEVKALWQWKKAGCVSAMRFLPLALKSLKKLAVYLILLLIIFVIGSLTSELKSPSFTEENLASRFMSLAMERTEHSYHLAMLKASEWDTTVHVQLPSFEKVKVVSTTSHGTCFNPEGRHTDCEGHATRSSVVLQYHDIRCKLVSSPQGVVSSNCTE
jgi:hypothetical protein